MPKFQSLEGEKMEKREKGPAWAYRGSARCQTTYGPSLLLPLPSVPGQWKPVNHSGSCALLFYCQYLKQLFQRKRDWC